MSKDKIFTVKELKALGFEHYYDSELEDEGTPDEFSYSVFKIDIKCYHLEATIEYDRNKKPRLVDFNLDDVEFHGRPLTAADINILKEII